MNEITLKACAGRLVHYSGIAELFENELTALELSELEKLPGGLSAIYDDGAAECCSFTIYADRNGAEAVIIADAINGDITGVVSLQDFIRETIEYYSEYGE